MPSHTTTDPRLLGTWRSDKALTLAEWVFREGITPEERAKVESWFGKFSMRYTPARVFTEYDGDRTVCPYHVAAVDDSSVAIVRRTEGKNEIQHIHFVDANVHWVSVGRNREFFRRVSA